MAEVILICGKICSGKSTWAKALCRESGALCLSVDELMLALLPERLGDPAAQFPSAAAKLPSNGNDSIHTNTS